MTERESQLMDMLRRMCEAMKCKDCPLSVKGYNRKTPTDGGVCKFARFITASMGGTK